MKFDIDYCENVKYFFINVSDAVKMYLGLETDKGKGLVLSVHALNPFLKCLETMYELGAIIIPGHYCNPNTKKDEVSYMVIKTSLVWLKPKTIELCER